ncbi:phosphoenolpyruvate-protein phosphotransferase [Candidatus Vecturithrix granuli]|uniref:Phosphoenolpyruvate-protein phosphotransferase n=1 Tax=Vecturithrix granuli TaxID=1499967 RepID=A0A081C0H3_VECG1|nr:phosphoenolpyruvate-protein phosphotransferase [Candidatus Vecturithrix granuli]
MVGLVLVSHSRKLADTLIALIQQVSAATIPIARAAGVGEDHQDFGTDAMEIVEAIQSIYSDDGVLVLMDLGSALLSAEMALELLPEEMQTHIRLCSAPFVEGAIFAAVQISIGSDLDSVDQEARQSLLPKIDQLSASGKPIENLQPEIAPSPAPTSSNKVQAPQQMILTIMTKHGLHARPVAKLVQMIKTFDADVEVATLLPAEMTEAVEEIRIARGPVPAASLNRLASLGVVQGDRILVSAHGRMAKEALQAIRLLVAENFGEKDGEIESEAQPEFQQKPSEAGAIFSEKALTGIPVSEGIAIGPVFHYHQARIEIPQHDDVDPQTEWNSLLRAIALVQNNIVQRRRQVQSSLGEAKAAIFDAHLFMLEDVSLLERVRRQIFEQHSNAAAAWDREMKKAADSYRATPNLYLQQRAVDVEDVAMQVLSVLLGKTTTAFLTFPEPGVLIVEELTPTSIAQLDNSKIRGIVTVIGGPTSHSAILARVLGMPTITGIHPSVLMLPEGIIVAIDGFQGKMWIEPDVNVLNELHRRQTEWLTTREQLLASSHQPALTRDGRRVKIAANAGSELDAAMAVKNGAEAIGILRTEFLYLTRDSAPTEEEQKETLTRMGEIMGERPIYVRTLDVGGDKDIPYLHLPVEANPFLGVRSLRFSFKKPDIFLTQLRAILRAGVQANLRIMLPMISQLDDLIQAQRYVEQAHQALEQEGIPHRWPLEAAMMVETPSAALLTAAFAKHLDYFSIGTNDLTQYTLAAERGNPELTSYHDGLHPSVLYLIRKVVQDAHQFGKKTGVCGELAGDPTAVPILVGLGVDELSMNPGSIPRVKDIIRRLELPSVSRLAENALQAESAIDVRCMAEKFLSTL